MSVEKKKKAVVLLSGGMDSSVVLAMALQQGYGVHALTFQYGQRHSVEIEMAKKQADMQGVKNHTVMDLDLAQFGGSVLTSDGEVPKGTGTSAKIPATYVPARNTVFLSVALSLAEAIGARDIFIGVSAVDYSGYPDCRPEFIAAFQEVANRGTKAADGKEKYKIHAPLIHLTKEETVLAGQKLGVAFGSTRTCYDPAEDGSPCGVCDSCVLRQKGFEQAGVADPVRVRGK